MIDHLFSAALTFCLLGAGTAAVGPLLLEPATAKHGQVRTVELPRVVVVGNRLAAPTTVAKSDGIGTAASRVQ